MGTTTTTVQVDGTLTMAQAVAAVAAGATVIGGGSRVSTAAGLPDAATLAAWQAVGPILLEFPAADPATPPPTATVDDDDAAYATTAYVDAAVEDLRSEVTAMMRQTAAAATVDTPLTAAAAPLVAPAAGTQTHNVTYKPAANVTDTLYAPVAGLQTRVKNELPVTATFTVTISPPAGYTFDNAATPVVLKPTEEIGFRIDPNVATNIELF